MYRLLIPIFILRAAFHLLCPNPEPHLLTQMRSTLCLYWHTFTLILPPFPMVQINCFPKTPAVSPRLSPGDSRRCNVPTFNHSISFERGLYLQCSHSHILSNSRTSLQSVFLSLLQNYFKQNLAPFFKRIPAHFIIFTFYLFFIFFI